MVRTIETVPKTGMPLLIIQSDLYYPRYSGVLNYGFKDRG